MVQMESQGEKELQGNWFLILHTFLNACFSKVADKLLTVLSMTAIMSSTLTHWVSIFWRRHAKTAGWMNGRTHTHTHICVCILHNCTEEQPSL